MSAASAFRPTCPRCGHKSAPNAEWCAVCGTFLLIMPRAEWEAECERLRRIREEAA